MMPIADANSALVNALVPEWAQVRGNVLSLLPSLPPSEASLVSIVLEYQEPVQRWKERSEAGSSGAADDFKLAVLGLLLWALLKSANAESRREILGALWGGLEIEMKEAAKAHLRNWRSQRNLELVEDFVQEAYFCFEEIISGYDPNRWMLQKFVRYCYHRRMINIASQNRMQRTGVTEINDEINHPVDEQGPEAQIAAERAEELNAILRTIETDKNMSSKVAAFRAVKLQQRLGKEVADEMEHSEAWVSKACAAVWKAVVTMRQERESKGT